MVRATGRTSFVALPQKPKRSRLSSNYRDRKEMATRNALYRKERPKSTSKDADEVQVEESGARFKRTAAEARERMLSGGGGGSRSRGATVWRGGRGEMTGGRLHHDIRHSSLPPRHLSLCHSARPRSSVVTSESPPRRHRRRRRRRRRPPPARLFLPLAVTPPFEMSLLLPTAGAEAVTTIIVSEVTSLESATGRETRHRQKETKRVRQRRKEKGREGVKKSGRKDITRSREESGKGQRAAGRLDDGGAAEIRAEEPNERRARSLYL